MSVPQPVVGACLPSHPIPVPLPDAIHTDPHRLDDPLVFGHRLAQMIWEVCHDRRSIEQLIPWVTESVYENVLHRLILYRFDHANAPEHTAEIRVGAHRGVEVTPDEHEYCCVVAVGRDTHGMALRIRHFPFGLRATALGIL